MRNLEKRTHFCEVVSLLHDGSVWIKVKELHRDLRTLNRRFSNEGLSFLTKTLPKLGKAIDRALSGNAPFCCPTSFRCKSGSAAPNFLGYAVRAVFNDDGWLRDDVCPLLVKWLRTFCFYSYKLELPFSTEVINGYCDDFVETDEQVANLAISSIDDGHRNIMRDLIHGIFNAYRLGTPQDGPGVSSDVRRSSKRMAYVPPSKVRNHFGRDMYHQPLEHFEEYGFGRMLGIDPLLAPLASFLVAFEATNLQDLGTEVGSKPSKVLFVPKDSRGPRVIACEPASHMFAQQAVRKGMYGCVESSPLTRGRVNFRDQSINAKLTFDSRYATLDLKEASDRVSNSLVADLFPSRLYADMDACRTAVAELPDGRSVELAKFAPMGSALCFPTMAVLAYASVTSAIYLAGGPLPNRQRDVFVYGDDIIVPNEWAHVAIKGLEAVGLLVNKDKSFIDSRFRESCGQDTLDGNSVNVLRRRKLRPSGEIRRNKGSKVVVDDGGYAMHTCALMNSSLDSGFLNLAVALESNLSKYLRSPIPFGTAESSYICHLVSSTEVAWKLNKELGYSKGGKMRAYVFRDTKGKTQHSSYSRLRSSFSSVVCPITGDTRPAWEDYGLRKPILQISTLKEWWVGSFV